LVKATRIGWPHGDDVRMVLPVRLDHGVTTSQTGTSPAFYRQVDGAEL
jgi:hypothetical protein